MDDVQVVAWDESEFLWIVFNIDQLPALLLIDRTNNIPLSHREIIPILRPEILHSDVHLSLLALVDQVLILGLVKALDWRRQVFLSESSLVWQLVLLRLSLELWQSSSSVLGSLSLSWLLAIEQLGLAALK